MGSVSKMTELSWPDQKPIAEKQMMENSFSTMLASSAQIVMEDSDVRQDRRI